GGLLLGLGRERGYSCRDDFLDSASAFLRVGWKIQGGRDTVGGAPCEHWRRRLGDQIRQGLDSSPPILVFIKGDLLCLPLLANGHLDHRPVISLPIRTLLSAQFTLHFG